MTFDPDLDLQGTVAVVTGAFSGIGLALACQAAKRGCKGVAMLDVEATAADDAVKTVSAATAACVEILCLPCDVTSEASVNDSAVAVQARWPGVPIGLLCCNAGVVSMPGHRGSGLGGSTGVLDSTMNDWAFTMNVNLFGVVHTLKAYVPAMVGQKGRRSCVINTSSVAGITWAGMGPYSVSKHACAAVTEGLYQDLLARGVSNVSVHCLCPAVIATKIFQSERNRPGALQDLDDSSTHSQDAKTSAALKQATREMYLEDGLSADATAEAAFAQIGRGYFWLLVDNPPPMQLDIKASVGRRMSSILTQWPPQTAPEGVTPSFVQRELARRTGEILAKM